MDAAVTPASYKVQNYNRLKFWITLTTEYIHKQEDNCPFDRYKQVITMCLELILARRHRQFGNHKRPYECRLFFAFGC